MCMKLSRIKTKRAQGGDTQEEKRKPPEERVEIQVTWPPARLCLELEEVSKNSVEPLQQHSPDHTMISDFRSPTQF